MMGALIGLMEAEGGEPGDSAIQRTAWRRSKRAVREAKKAGIEPVVFRHPAERGLPD